MRLRNWDDIEEPAGFERFKPKPKPVKTGKPTKKPHVLRTDKRTLPVEDD